VAVAAVESAGEEDSTRFDLGKVLWEEPAATCSVDVVAAAVGSKEEDSRACDTAVAVAVVAVAVAGEKVARHQEEAAADDEDHWDCTEEDATLLGGED
jgi:hypothetical protein